MEEERRLFYVALTRTKRDLHLYTLINEPVSQFLQESQWRTALNQIQRLQTLLADDPVNWQAADARDLIKHSARWGLISYFADWWNAEPLRKTAVAHTLQHFYMAAAEQDVLERLGITAGQIAPWQRIAPLPPEKNRPRLQGSQRTANPNQNQPPRYPLRRQVQVNDNPLLTNPNANPNSLTNRLRRTKELAQRGDEATIPGLVAALDDPTSTVRYLARSGLVNIGGSAVIKALHEYLNGKTTPDGAEEARQILKYLT